MDNKLITVTSPLLPLHSTLYARPLVASSSDSESEELYNCLYTLNSTL